MANKSIFVELPKVKRQFDNKEFVLTKISYNEEDAKADQAYYQKAGKEAKVMEDGRYWLVYTKIGV
ncbi:MAG: hypothetical protein PHN78_01055 [Dehalococcoidales bacterium]|nr:hypothetical protein [Dehalococcoidales bacterium]